MAPAEPAPTITVSYVINIAFMVIGARSLLEAACQLQMNPFTT
jgi:hypothetical protein